MCPVLHWCILFFWIPWTLFCLSCPFFSLMCNFNVANSKKNSYRKHDIFFVTNPNIKDQDLHLSRKFFYFIFVIMQSICMEQCHSHLQCGYILIPIKKTLWTLWDLYEEPKLLYINIYPVFFIRTGSIVRPLPYHI